MEDILFRLFDKCPHLTELDLSYKNIGFSKVKVLAEILEKTDELVIVTKDNPNDSLINTLKMQYEKNENVIFQISG